MSETIKAYAAPEAGAGLGPLITQDLHVGQAGVVIDGVVQVAGRSQQTPPPEIVANNSFC